MNRTTLARLGAALALLFLPPSAFAATVSGRVIDSAGTPVAGLTVAWEPYRSDEQVLVDETRGFSPAPLGETKTGTDGRFRVTLDKAGVEVAIRVLPGNFAGALLAGPYDSSEDVELDDIELPAAEKVSGRVTDEKGKPVSGAKVVARSGEPFDEEGIAIYAEATSGTDGSFSISNAPGRMGTITVRATGYAPFTRMSMQRRTGAERVTLAGGGIVRGILLDSSGKPAPDAIVLSGSLAARTGADGAYELAGVPAGTRSVEALKGDLAARNDAVRVKKNETVEASLRLGRSAVIAGSVVDEKTRRPLTGVRVSAATGAFPFRMESAARRARTDAKGRFRIAGLAPRRYSIRASRTEYLTLSMPGVVAGVSTPGAVSIALTKAAGISGRVSDEKGAPVAGARVRFSRPGSMRAMVRGGFAALRGSSTVTTGSDGVFRMRNLAAGRNLTLVGGKAGYVPAERHGVTLRSGEIVKDVQLVLKRGLEARGRVVDAAGQPIAGAEVRLNRPEGGPGRFMVQIAGLGNRERPDATSAADGTFRLAGLEPGEYALSVTREGYAMKRVPSVTVSAEPPNEWPPVVLSPGVAIGGSVRNTKGEPVVGAQLFTFGEGMGSREGTTDQEGRFRIDGLGTDRALMLNVRADGYGMLQRRVSPPAEDLSLVLKTSGTIRGRVEDASTNRPVTDFTASYSEARGGGLGGIRIVMGGAPNERTFQSADGSFELPDVPEGKWNVTASAPGYRPAEVAGIEISEGETKDGVVLSLKKGAVVTGRVVDPRRGGGVANASVSWSDASDASPGAFAAAAIARMSGGGNAVATDADGRFRIDGLPGGRITLTADHPDYLEVSKQVEVEIEDETRVDLTLSLGGSIAGTVVGKDGRSPVPGAQVGIEELGGSSFGAGPDAVRADAAGNFLFEHLKPGRFRVSARSVAGNTSSKEVVLAESQQLDGVLLELATGAFVRGTVSGLPRERLGGIRVFGSSREFNDSAVTGDDGKFTLRDVPPGVLRLSAMTAFPTSRSVTKNLDVPEGSREVSVEIVFEGSSRLSGRVTRGDRPLSGLSVSAFPDPPNPAAGRSGDQTDEDGRYSIEGLTDGNYQVNVFGQGVSYRRTIAVSGDTEGDIALPAMTISGFVTSESSNEPLEGVSVQAESGGESGRPALRQARTDSRGFFSLDDVDSGNYQVTARKTGFQMKSQPVSVGSSSVELNLTLARGAGLEIRATDGLTGIPLQSLTALAYTASGSVAFSGFVSLDAEGKGEISSLTPGSYSLNLHAQGYAARSFTVQVPSPTLGVAMTPGGRIEVRTDVSVSGRLVDASGAVYRPFPFRLDGRVSAGPPVTVWENVAPGSYQLVVTGASGERTYPIAVSEGRTTVVEVR